MAIQLKIDGVAIAHMPSEFKCTLQDLDYSASGSVTRAINGELSRNYITTKRKLELKYSALSWAKLSAVLQQMPLGTEFFEVYYPDTYTGDYQTKTFYVSDRPAGVIKTALNTGDEIFWGSMTFSLIEK